MFFNIFFEDADAYDKYYDKSANLIYIDRNKINIIHFSLTHEKLHPILLSVEYATILLKRNRGDDVQRAHDILHTAITFQDVNKQNETFGMIATYSEAPLSNSSPQFFNLPSSAMFCINFLQIIEHFPHLLSKDLLGKLKQACYNITFQFSNASPHSIIPVSHQYMLSICIFFKCGILFNNPAFLNLAANQLTTFYTGLIYSGGFWEYNSHSELYINSEILCTIKKTITDRSLLNMINELYDTLWKGIAENYHMGLKILTGPRSDESQRIDENLFHGFILTALGIPHKNFPEPAIPLESRCPEKYRFYFENKTPSHFNRSLISRGSTCSAFYNSKIVSNYIRPNYTLGSFNLCEFWSWHTPLIGYLTVPDSNETYQYGVTVLLNGTKLACAKLNSIQHNGCILGHISMLTNKGLVHPNLTPTNGILYANDFRIRFYMSGNTKKLRIRNNKNSVTVQYHNTIITYTIPYICFDGFTIRLELSVEENDLYFDAVILNSKEDFKIDLNTIECAICQFVLQASTTNELICESEYEINGNKLTGTLLTEGYKLELHTLYKPTFFEYANSNDCQFINNTKLESYTEFNSARSNQYKMTVFSKQDDTYDPYEPGENISDELDKIPDTPPEKLNALITSLLDRLLKYNYSLGIFKHYSVRIVRALFSDAINKHYQFETIINNNYFDIYPKISNAPSHDVVCHIILDVLEGILKNRQIIEHKSMKQNIITKVTDIIEKNYSNPALSLTEVSDILGVSESYISREFKKKTNTTYVRHLIKIRMEKAKELLLENPSVEAVAPLCGYLNVPSFNRAFKQYTGVTATAWIKNKL